MLVSLGLHAQAQQNSVDERVEGILNQMTLEEKLSYISGVGFDPPLSIGRVGFLISRGAHGADLGFPRSMELMVGRFCWSRRDAWHPLPRRAAPCFHLEPRPRL